MFESRPRINSIEMGENLDKQSDCEISQSTDEPIVFLTNLDVSKYEQINHEMLATTDCKHTHELIGFVPLSHTICTEDCSFEGCSDCSIDTETRDVNPFEENQISDDAAISIYRLSCDKINKANIFKSNDDINLDKLRDSLKSMQATFEMLRP